MVSCLPELVFVFIMLISKVLEQRNAVMFF